MVFTCEYCNNNFSDKKSLITHKNSAQYCLKIQGREIKTYECQCGKEYSMKKSLLRHQAKCSYQIKPQNTLHSQNDELLKLMIEKYDNLVNGLQQQISNLTTTTTTNNNNNRNMVMNNLQPITDADLKEHLEVLSLDFIQLGAKGYADFAGNYPLKDKVLCTDRSRKKLKYKNEDGELTDDGRLLAQRFFTAISEKNTAILSKAYSELHIQVQNIAKENKAGTTDITGLLNKATNIQDILIKTQRAASGEDSEFTQEFLNYLVKIL